MVFRRKIFFFALMAGVIFLGVMIISKHTLFTAHAEKKKADKSIGICRVEHYDSSDLKRKTGYVDTEDRECAFGVSFKKPGSRRSLRYVYSCTVPAGKFNCGIELNDHRVPKGFYPVSAWADSVMLGIQVFRGCVYVPGYPKAEVRGSAFGGHQKVNITHRYDCYRLEELKEELKEKNLGGVSDSEPEMKKASQPAPTLKDVTKSPAHQ